MAGALPRECWNYKKETRPWINACDAAGLKNRTMLKIINGKLLTPDKIIEGGSLLIQEGKIADVSPGAIETSDVEVIDASGYYVAPGFIDIHVHGGGGYDFMDGTVDAFLGVAE